MIEQKYINMILGRVNIKDVVSRYITGRFKKRGDRYWACCPFHKEETPSFCVNLTKGTWHCFGKCNEGGSVISFVMKAEKLSLPLAVRKLLKDELGIDQNENDEKEQEHSR